MPSSEFEGAGHRPNSPPDNGGNAQREGGTASAMLTRLNARTIRGLPDPQFARRRCPRALTDDVASVVIVHDVEQQEDRVAAVPDRSRSEASRRRRMLRNGCFRGPQALRSTGESPQAPVAEGIVTERRCRLPGDSVHRHHAGSDYLRGSLRPFLVLE
jgi:hypothetical protein